MNTFVARPALGKLLMMLIASLAFVFAGFWIAGFLGDVPKPGKEWVGWLSIIFFGLCSVSIFSRLFDSDDQIRISSLGIYLKQWSHDTIPWSEITKVSVWKYKNNKTILLYLRNSQRFPSTTLIGKLAAANRALTGGDISINLGGTDKSFDEAMTAIDYFWSKQNAINTSTSVIGQTASTPTPRGFGRKKG
jgi:hypothetical protein